MTEPPPVNPYDIPVAEVVDEPKHKRPRIDVVMTLPQFSLKVMMYITALFAVLFAALGLMRLTAVQTFAGFFTMIGTATIAIAIVHFTRRRKR